MLDKPLRQFKDAALAPLIPHLAVLSPNQMSLLGFAIGLAACGALAMQQYLLGLGLWALNRLADGLDGALARHQQKQGKGLGGYLDILLDFVIYAAIPISLVFPVADATLLWILVLMLASFYLNAASWMYLAALLQQDSQSSPKLTSVAMPTGIIEGTETILIYSLCMVLPQYLPWLFGIMTLLTLATVVQRWLWARQVLA